jgi:hypothetical protein
MYKRDRKWIVLVMTLVLAGCGPTTAGAVATGRGGGGGGEAPDAGTTDTGTAVEQSNYFPMAIGNNWTYRVTNSAGVSADRMTTVEAMEPAGGTAGPLAFRIRNEALATTTINWEQLSGMVVVRYRQSMLDATATLLVDKTYTPSSAVFDEAAAHLVAGVTWNEAYMETQAPATGPPKTSQEFVEWTVEAVDDVVTVPAGTFTCVRVRRHHSSSKNPADEVNWYATGMGSVKESGGGPQSDETRELVSFNP